MTVQTTQELRDAARALMENGRPVFLISGEKIPYRNCQDCKGKRVGDPDHEICPCLPSNGGTGMCHGFYAATTKYEIFEGWLEEHPDCQMIAMPTGRETGIFVMEYDPKNGGDLSYNELIAEHNSITTETNMSPGGGLHHLFEMPNWDIQGGINGKLWPGIDIKGSGGYVLMPPSRTDKGNYVVMNDTEPKQAPKWLLDKIFDYQSKNKWDAEARLLRRREARNYDPDLVTPEQAEHVRKTVEYWQGRIANSPDGKQNINIYTGSRVLFSLCYAGLLDEEEAQLALEDACEEGNHPQRRSLLAIESGAKAATIDPDPVEEALTNDINIIETFDQDDIGNGNRVVFWRGTDIRYDNDKERFYTWAGQKWVMARDGRVRNIVEDVHSKLIATEADFYSNIAMPPSEKDKKSPKTYRELFVTWAKSQRFARKIGDTINILKGREEIWCEPDDFDVDPYHFNVANGVVHLQTHELLPHDREFMCSQISKEVNFDPSASCPQFERFLTLVQPNRAHRRYLQRLIGYTMLGELRDQIFAVHIGSGGNGKGVFLDTIAFILGEYATTGQRESFVRKSNSNRIPADIASYEGKRLVLVDELNDNQKLDEGLLKDITGGGIIKAEAKNVNPWEYTPKFVLHFRTNHMPDLPADQAVVRRFRPVKWTETPTGEQWDSFSTPHHSTPFQFLTKTEAPGILNWILEGTREYLLHGLQVPDDLQVEALDMLQENDPFLIFMAENLVKSEGAMLDGAKLYSTFKEWYGNHGFSGNPPSSRALYKDIKTGKYQGKWEHGDVRGRFTFKNAALTTLLVK